MRMTAYNMLVEIIDRNKSDKIITAPVHKNWIGGQQAIIKPNSELNFKNFLYRIIFSAEQDGIFNIEARSSSSSIKLIEKNLKFDSVKDNSKNCYIYNIPTARKNEELVYEIKSIKGAVNYFVYNGNSNEEINSKMVNEGQNGEGNEKRIVIDQETRNTQKDGNWKICMMSVDGRSSLYTIQGYMSSNMESVKEFQKLLYSK